MTISLFYTSSTNPTVTTTAAAVIAASSSSSVVSSPQSTVVASKIHQEQEKEESSSTTSAATMMDDKCEKCLKGYEERWSRKQRLEWNLENTPFFRDGIYLLKATIFSSDDEDLQNDDNEKDRKNKSNITLRITYAYQYSLSKFFSVFPGLSSVSEGIRTLWTFLDKHCLCKECGKLLNKEEMEEKGCPSCEMFVGFSAFLEKKENCAICFEPVYRFTLPCGHRFHKLCMNSVKFEGQRNCPLCRAEIPYDVLCSIYDYDMNKDLGYEEEDDDDSDDDNDDDNEEEEE